MTDIDFENIILYPVQLPNGFEQKYDERSKKVYFIDHGAKKTQWQDPRLENDNVWDESHNIIVSLFVDLFEGLTPVGAKKALLESDMVPLLAIENLKNSGYKKKSVKQKPTSSHPVADAGSSSQPQCNVSSTHANVKTSAGGHNSTSSVNQTSENDVHRAIIHKQSDEFPKCDATIAKSVYEEDKQEEVAKRPLISKGYKDKKTIEEEKHRKETQEREEACAGLIEKFSEVDPDSIKKLMHENEFNLELVEQMLMEEQIKNRLTADNGNNYMIDVDVLSDTIIYALKTTGDDIEAAYRLVKENINKEPSKSSEYVENSTCNGEFRIDMKKLAKGPDPALYHGPNKNLYRGPNPEIVYGPMAKQFA